ncbi:hypothetical protein SU69_07240 [Thermosipho melanesiensis]|uniref:Uncharacterized protein n=2 Tax=Thermosipho melanesiensis TaxID=46541 RepID=A6LMX5_THEM4|nr:hypothetical protein [Thermosipho melanesiensis]ABR31276.1 hypothetical protein Tmel_1429 [Thermosipho melanesiensis BI429]APT74356.1 hypothetical protein BW47_07565 [Thermosipho melanesiensis]OOC36299.1 hypothetical protein SU68_07310 [Thermosipho melanesiensis]OOC37117.1 hypothetical protein SU69_07240 [Thermosipho melanesiensis]OOC37869.1 hypothetical protein SU70_07250 [Thermosipho melanesiensis]
MIGYFSVRKINEKYLGGILIIDERGIPIEFKYTEPITPTGLQKIIYGSSLEEYLSVEIIGKTLIEKIENKPEIIFVNDPSLTFKENIVLIIEINTSSSETIEINNRFFKITPFNDTIKGKILEISEKIEITEPFSRLEKALSYICES